MKWLLRSLPLLALGLASCTTSTSTTVLNPVAPTIGPTITGFSPDTVWTFGTLTIHGTNFGFDPLNLLVTIDTTQAWIQTINDTVMTVTVPEYARTGLIHIREYEQSATSAQPVVVNATFHPDSLNDTIPIGSSFSIKGTGLNHYHGVLLLYVDGFLHPIDSLFPDRIVSHLIPTDYSGDLTVSDSGGTYDIGTFTVTRASAWKTLSEIWDHLTVTETHERVGYVNGPANPIDSIWKTTATYTGQRDTDIAGTLFERTASGLNYPPAPSIYGYDPIAAFQMVWDTIHQTAQIRFQRYSSSPATPFHTADTTWSYFGGGENVPAPLPVDGDIEFTLPGIACQITEDSMDSQGLVNWEETTTGTVTSGAFDLILKQ